MSYLIIIVVLALVLAPVFWIMPSPGQRRQAAMRQRAMALGLQVKVCDLPQSHRAKVRKEDPVQGVVYRLPWQAKVKNNDTFQNYCVRVPDGIECNASRSDLSNGQLKEFLQALPDFCIGLELSNTGVGLFWREFGELQRVDTIFQSLDQLREKLQDTYCEQE